MAITDEQVKDFETKFKKNLFDSIHHLADVQTELITLIQTNQKYLGTDEDLPNIGITLNNKLVELSHQFQKAGISIFSSKIEDYGPLKLDFISVPVLGEATILDMISKVEQGTQLLEKYNSELEISSASSSNQSGKSTPIRKWFLKLKDFLIPSSQNDLSYLQEKKQTLTSYLSDYSSIDNQLWKYNLRDNVIPSLVNYMKTNSYSKETVFDILKDAIIPDLQKLGLEDLVPPLKEELNKAYEEKDLNSWDLPPMEKIEIQEAQQQIAQKYVSDLDYSQINENLIPDKQETNR